MNTIDRLDIETVLPGQTAVLKSQGMPESVTVSDVIKDLYESAIMTFRKSVQAKFILSEISIVEFGILFEGEGENAADAILRNIYPRSDYLAVYALTMGKEVSEEISRLFDTDEFALAAMLDAVASNAADKGSRYVERWYEEYLNRNGSVPNTVLGYSPGYCGWHISGQRKLFRILDPEKIGITLNDSYLMTPLKSISGVLVCGDKDIHIFKCNYSYCADCKNKSCLDRMKALR